MPKNIIDILWDGFCCASIIGIWPRYIEPKLICRTNLALTIKNLPQQLRGFRIVQFSDLHLNSHLSDNFLDRLSQKIKQAKPDIIVFTGDFLCYSQMKEEKRLLHFLNSLYAPYGCYAIYGNHDYSQFVSVNDQGQYSIIEKQSSVVIKGFKRLFSAVPSKRTFASNLDSIPPHQELTDLIQKTPFKYLHNETINLFVKGATLNLCGLGEYMLNQCLPAKAFANYDPKALGIILAHNPDSIPLLNSYPGQVILCGHTHGGQINLPIIRNKFITIENPQYIRSLNYTNGKLIYTNRGIGGVMPFRWKSPPDVFSLTLEAPHAT